MKVKRAEKYGFCAGVRLADMRVRRFVQQDGQGAVLGEIVHNQRVVEEMEALGIRTVKSVDEVEAGTVIFSAHGVAPSTHAAARRRGLEVLDTTCPFVYEIHDQAIAALDDGYHLVFVGDPRHREVVGYTSDLDPSRYHILASMEEARRVDWGRYPKVKIFFQTTLDAEQYEDLALFVESQARETCRTDSICRATRQNQDAARQLAMDPEVEVLVVIGGRHSANTRHLWELCQRYKPSYLIHEAGDLDPAWFEGVETVGVTAGASTPDDLVDEVEVQLQRLGETVARVSSSVPPRSPRPPARRDAEAREGRHESAGRR